MPYSLCNTIAYVHIFLHTCYYETKSCVQQSPGDDMRDRNERLASLDGSARDVEKERRGCLLDGLG